MNPKLAKALEECITGNPVPLMTSVLTVAPKSGSLIPFGLSPATEIIARELASRRTRRQAWLKARQLWVTTFWQAVAFSFFCTMPNFRAGLVLLEDEAAEEAFKRFHVFYDNLPRGMQPPLKYDRADLIELEPPLSSRLFIGTHRTSEFGRSRTVNMLILSELGFYPDDDASRLANSAVDAVPQDGWIIAESTPNGMGTRFEKLYTEAKEGQAGWMAGFLPWYLNPEYALEIPDAVPLDLSAQETEWKAKFGLSDAQLRWYRLKREEKAMLGHEEQMAQEFPTDDVTCWLSSQEAAFPGDAANALHRMLRRCHRPAITVNGVCIWRGFEPNSHYLLYADCAEGLKDGDYQYAALGDSGTGKIVAKVQGKMTQDVFARNCVELCGRYGNALLAWERQQSLLFGNTVSRLGYRNVFRHGTGPDARAGLPTSSHSKPMMVQAMRSALVTGQFETPDEVAVQQMLKYRVVKDKNGYASTFDAPSGQHDDGCMASMGFNYIRKAAPVGVLGTQAAPAVDPTPDEVLAW